jgi:hypothetical protein
MPLRKIVKPFALAARIQGGLIQESMIQEGLPLPGGLSRPPR